MLSESCSKRLTQAPGERLGQRDRQATTIAQMSTGEWHWLAAEHSLKLITNYFFLILSPLGVSKLDFLPAPPLCRSLLEPEVAKSRNVEGQRERAVSNNRQTSRT